MIEKIKIIVAYLLNYIGMLPLLIKIQSAKKDTIRIINYHDIPNKDIDTFESHLKFYKKYFKNINYGEFEEFKNGSLSLNHQGIMLTFDDGWLNDYTNALPLLEKYGFTGYFFCSSNKVGQKDYMSWQQMNDLIARNHIIGCHTHNHHHMNPDDTIDTLDIEIIKSKQLLSKNLNTNIDIFCWCFGDDNGYTKNAQELIEKNYKYGFMTNSELVTKFTDNYFIQRSNVEARFPLPLVKFQLSGIMDYLYKNKRNNIYQRLK